ncbi:MAG: aminotransferase class III-fold pyridoxal phosphate-dependent enzyme [Candidatus Riflebacteria bacterium]|nr:aminotransferase class III-fold pyridoxal phosphate-dependent enzyme [Candidatus Riflebacteria bacterium]
MNTPSFSDRYIMYAKPGLGRLLNAFGLGITYERAKGDYVWYRDAAGNEVKVLDLVGSFGATLLGHNPPALIDRLIELMRGDSPQFVQGSIRAGASDLAARLAEAARIKLATEYQSTFFSTGAEAVEASIKHLILIRRKLLKRRSEELLISASSLLRRNCGTGAVEIDGPAIEGFPEGSFASGHALLEAIDSFNRRTINGRFRLLALDGGYHGQTLGALGLTHNRHYREPFIGHLLPVTFIPVDVSDESGDAAGVKKAIDAGSTILIGLEATHKSGVGDDSSGQLASGGVRLITYRITDVLGIFLEPVLGEGGVFPLPGKLIQKIVQVARAANVCVVADEIQTGMGRTGTLFAWEQSGAPAPDMLLLSKFLGGGIMKISAVMTRTKIAEDEFGLVHASTFAEDELGCRAGLFTLDLLLFRDGALLKRVRERGQLWKKALESIRVEFPDVIRDVRGGGLLWGIEFQDLRNSGSNLLRFICTQGDLGYALASYLLHAEHIRVAPALGFGLTVRVEPSVLLDEAGIIRVTSALRRLCELLRMRDTAKIVACMTLSTKESIGEHHNGISNSPEKECCPAGETAIEHELRLPPLDFRYDSSKIYQPDPVASDKVAFIGHFIDPTFLAKHEPSLARLSTDRLRKFIESSWEFIEPCLFARRDIRSKTGAIVNFNFIGLSVTSEILLDHLRRRDLSPVRGLIRRAVETARDAGCKIVGFGQFTSILTRNCLEICVPPVRFTSGNSLTVGMAHAALLQVLEQRGRRLEDIRCAVLGAGGNIGSTFARILADKVGSLVLIGGTGRDSQSRLEKTAATIRLEQGREISLTFGNMDDCRACDVIVTATNSTEPVVKTEHLGSDVVIFDVSVPSAVAPEAGRRAGVEWFKGGVVSLPERDALNIGALPLEPGFVYACMAETMLLGLERRWEDYSVGDIDKARVLEMLSLAQKHGFTLGRLKGESAF